jgi:hypothetical protein
MKDKIKVEKCIAQVAKDTRFLRYRQCNRNAIPGSKYCSQHDPDLKRERESKKNQTKDDKYRREREQYLRNQTLNEMAKGIPSGILHQYKLVRKDK